MKDPIPRILSILALVNKEWNQLSQDNSLWKWFAENQEISINLSLTEPGIIKSRVKRFATSFLLFPNYQDFEDKVLYKKQMRNPKSGIEKSYDKAPSTPPLFDALRRYRAFFPDSEGLRSPASTSLITRSDFYGVIGTRKAKEMLLSQDELKYLIFLSKEQSLDESWGYVNSESSIEDDENRRKDVVCIFFKSVFSGLVEKRIDLTHFDSEEEFESYINSYLLECQSKCEYSFKEGIQNIISATKTGHFHGIMYPYQAEDLLKKQANGNSCYLFYIDIDTLTLKIGTFWAYNQQFVHKPIPNIIWSLSPNNFEPLCAVNPFVPIPRKGYLDRNKTFRDHPELAKNPSLVNALMPLINFHGQISRVETEKLLTTSGDATSFLLRLSSNEKNRLILSICYPGKKVSHQMMNNEFLEKAAVQSDFPAQLKARILEKFKMPSEPLPLPCKRDFVKGYTIKSRRSPQLSSDSYLILNGL